MTQLDEGGKWRERPLHRVRGRGGTRASTLKGKAHHGELITEPGKSFNRGEGKLITTVDSEKKKFALRLTLLQRSFREEFVAESSPSCREGPRDSLYLN